MDSSTEENEYIINKAYRGISCRPCSSANHKQLDRHRLIFFQGFLSSTYPQGLVCKHLGLDQNLFFSQYNAICLILMFMWTSLSLSSSSLGVLISLQLCFLLTVLQSQQHSENPVYVPHIKFLLCDLMCIVFTFLAFQVFISFC